MHVYIIYTLETKKFIWFCVCVCGYLQQTASEPFAELCFEADKWIAWLYLSWGKQREGEPVSWGRSNVQTGNSVAFLFAKWLRV